MNSTVNTMRLNASADASADGPTTAEGFVRSMANDQVDATIVWLLVVQLAPQRVDNADATSSLGVASRAPRVG